MKIQAEPTYVEIPITEMDISLVNGQVRSFMLRDGDTVVETKTEIVITLKGPPECERIFLRHVCRISTRATSRKIKALPSPGSTGDLTGIAGTARGRYEEYDD